MKAISAKIINLLVFWTILVLALETEDAEKRAKYSRKQKIPIRADKHLSNVTDLLLSKTTALRPRIDPVNADVVTKSRTSNCEFSVPQRSKDEFRNYVNKGKMNFMFIKLNISDGRWKYGKTDKYFYPLYLTWTYKGGPGAGFPILNYPYDFKIRSLGFLSWHVLDRVIIDIRVPENCSIDWGEPEVMLNLLKAMRNVSSAPMEHSNTSYWCYGEKFHMSLVRTWLAHVTGMESETTGYRCSTPEEPLDFTATYRQTPILHILNLISVALFSYTPLYLYILDGGGSSSSKSRLARKDNNYEVIRGTDSETDSDDESVLVMGDHSPFTWLSLLKKLFRSLCHSTHPIPNRLTKCFVLLFIIPSVIFVDVCVHYTYTRGSLIARARQDIPLGYFVIPLGYKLSSQNWWYFMGGPYVIYSLYFILSTILICIPDDLASVVVSHVDRGDDDAFESGCLLFLSAEVIENRGGINYRNNQLGSYKRLSDAIKCRIYMLLHPKFWLYFWSVWRARLKVCYRRLPFYGRTKIIVCLLLFPLALVTAMLLFFLDVLCCVAYYGIPIVFFTKTVAQNSVEYLTYRVIGYWGNAPVHRLGCVKLLGLILRFLFLFIILYVLSCTYTILTSTIQILTRTCIFVFYGILAFPNEAIMSIIFILIGIIYLYSALSSFNATYNDYLFLTIKVSLELEEERLGELLTEASESHSQSSFVSSYTSYKDRVPGVHEHLYSHIIERFRPVRIQVFLTFIYLAIVGGFMYISMSVIQSFNRQSELPIMVKLVATVGAGLLPRLFQMCWGSTNQKAEDERLKYKLKESIVKYWERHHLYLPLTDRA